MSNLIRCVWSLLDDRRSEWTSVVAITILLTSVLAGCNSREAYQIGGRVTYKNGSPIQAAVRVIRFEPTQDSPATVRKAASGNIDAEGKFEMFTRKPGDGVIAGKYAVTFTVLDQAMNGKSLIPSEYSRGDKTPFEIVVDQDRDDLQFELDKQ